MTIGLFFYFHVCFERPRAAGLDFFSYCGQMQTKEILALEKADEGVIILHQKGIFWRAYQNSAFLFYTHLRPLKVTVKLVTVDGTDVAYLGFPEKVLEEILQLASERGWRVERLDNQVRINTNEIVEREAYEEWQNTMRSEQVEAATSEASTIVPQYKTVIEKLRSYPILEKSPLETQQFVLNLQKEINGLI